MTEHSLYPASINLRYNTAFGSHVMTVPIREFSAISGGHPLGSCLAWDNTQKDLSDMVGDFVDLLKPFHATTTTFTSVQVNTYASETAPARPQAEGSIVSGAGTGSAGTAAAQATFMIRTASFGYLKLVMLDIAPGAGWLPVTAFPSPAYDAMLALEALLKDSSNGWSGRDNAQPAALRKVTYTLNEKLRKTYRLD